MPRKIMIRTADGKAPLLTEALADSEAQLQELVKAHPDLLPIEDFGMTGPLIVVGRETTLPSGAVDLVAIARSGELLIIEFKTGPQNSDFRAALAQLLDYGSDLWGRSYEEFERLVPLRYFASSECAVEELKGCRSLRAAAEVVWPGVGEEEFAGIRDALAAQLERGTLHYLLLAQRFTPPILRTIEYLNAVARPRFYAVEVVRFTGDGIDAFESRVTLRPLSRSTDPRTSLDETEFLGRFEGAPHEEAVRDLYQAATGLGCTIFWGAVGIAIRVPVPDRNAPVTVAWLYPPGTIGWSELTDITLGHDPGTLKKLPRGAALIEPYTEGIGRLEGAERVEKYGLAAYHFKPEHAAELGQQFVEALADLVSKLAES